MSGVQLWCVSNRRSLKALDWLNFFNADVETGVGPFVSLYLASSRHWDPAQIGSVVAIHSMVSVFAQTPAGLIVDASRRKRGLIIAAISVVALGSFFIVRASSYLGQLTNQIAIGIAVVFVSPTIAAISLGIVGKQGFSRRVGRNATFSHAGNMLTALLAGFIGYSVGQQWIFYVCAGFGLFSIAAALTISAADIDNDVARALPDKTSERPSLATFRSLLRDRRIPSFTLAVLVFHVANAGMLPLAGQELARQVGRSASIYMTACIVIAQLTMVPVAFSVSRWTDRIGRKPILVAAFIVLILRGILFGMFRGAETIALIEILDGIGTAIAEVIAIVTISDLAKGTGRFNSLQGAIQAAVGGGAFMSNLGAGWIAKHFGFPIAFSLLSATALLGLMLYVFLMPETANQRE